MSRHEPATLGMIRHEDVIGYPDELTVDGDDGGAGIHQGLQMRGAAIGASNDHTFNPLRPEHGDITRFVSSFSAELQMSV